MEETKDASDLQKMQELVDSIRVRVGRMLKNEPVMTCPLCEHPTYVHEHVPSSDTLDWVEYYVQCQHWDSKGKGCPFSYEIHLADRIALRGLFGERFVADDRIEKRGVGRER